MHMIHTMPLNTPMLEKQFLLDQCTSGQQCATVCAIKSEKSLASGRDVINRKIPPHHVQCRPNTGNSK